MSWTKINGKCHTHDIVIVYKRRERLSYIIKLREADALVILIMNSPGNVLL